MNENKIMEGIEIDEGFVEDFEREKLKQRVIGFTRGCYSINAQQREESKSRGLEWGGGGKPRNRATREVSTLVGKTELTTRIVKKKVSKKKGQKRGEGKKERSSCRKAGKGG